MTPTQWLAIPTEIRLTELPPLVSSSQNDNTETSTVYVNGKKIIVKQEDVPPTETSETGASSVYLYPMDGVPRLALECHTSSLGMQTLQTDVMIVTSKPRNPDYKVQNHIVATKRSRPVNFRLLRVKPGVQVSITLTYLGHIYGDEPVKRCKKHDECTWCKEHKFNQGFCIISKFHSYDLDHKGHPMAILTPRADDLDVDGTAEFSVVFACWNSCDIHVRCGKEMVLHIHIMQDGQLKKVEYTVQCCQNLLRDAFKDRKRKLLTQTAENMLERCSKSSVASSKMSNSSSKASVASTKKPIASSPGPPSSPPTSPINTKNERSEDIVVEGLDEERRDLIERLVRTIGGNTYRIPHLLRLKPGDDSGTEHQTNGSSSLSPGAALPPLNPVPGHVSHIKTPSDIHDTERLPSST